MFRNLSIFLPFNIEWEKTSAFDFESLELHLSPSLSLRLHGIHKHEKTFAPGSFLVGEDNKEKQREFETEFLPRKSQERIERAFQDDEITVFFTREECQQFRELFEAEKFYCRRVEVFKRGREVFTPDLNNDDFILVTEAFKNLNVMAVYDWQNQFPEEEQEIHAIREGAQKAIIQETKTRDHQTVNQTPPKKQKVWKAVVATLSVLGTSIVSSYGKRLLVSKRPYCLLTGGLCLAASYVIEQVSKTLFADVVANKQPYRV